MGSSTELLRQQWSACCERILARLSGLSDEEYLWEPVPNCWNVRPSAESPSGWTVDYPAVHPTPAPFTTIAWRLLHVADGNTIYWEHSFGTGSRNFWDLAPHGNAAGAIEYLTESQGLVTSSLALLDDEELNVLRPTHFGKSWPTARIFAVLINEQIHHGAEIGVLRDLYRYNGAP